LGVVSVGGALDRDAAFEVTRTHSVAGLLPPDQPHVRPAALPRAP
jgi:hypothetical protein